MKDDRLKGSIFEDGILNIEIRKRILEKVGGKTRERTDEKDRKEEERQRRDKKKER